MTDAKLKEANQLFKTVSIHKHEIIANHTKAFQMFRKAAEDLLTVIEATKKDNPEYA